MRFHGTYVVGCFIDLKKKMFGKFLFSCILFAVLKCSVLSQLIPVHGAALKVRKHFFFNSKLKKQFIKNFTV